MRTITGRSRVTLLLLALASVHRLESSNAFVLKPAASIHPNQRRACPVVVFLETKKTEEQVEELGLEYVDQGGNKQDPTPPNDEEKDKPLIPENSLVLTAAVLGALAVGLHAGDYAAFFDSLSQMKANVADPADFWPAVNFWIFFAVAHAILQPIFWSRAYDWRVSSRHVYTRKCRGHRGFHIFKRGRSFFVADVG
jgi:hypothetical protein